MLTLQLIKEQRDRVISGLNKKHFNGAEEAINQVLDISNSAANHSSSWTQTSLKPRKWPPRLAD